MRAYTTIYTPFNRVKNYTVVEICSFVENGTIAAKPIPDRKRMRAIMKNNIEAQQFRLSTAPFHLKAAQLGILQKLVKYRKLIPRD